MEQQLLHEKEIRRRLWELVGHGTDMGELLNVLTYTLDGINQGYILPTWRDPLSETPIDMVDALMTSLKTYRSILELQDNTESVDVPVLAVEPETSEGTSASEAAAAEVAFAWQRTLAQICIQGLVVVARPALAFNVTTANILFLLGCKKAGLMYMVPREADLIAGYLEPLVDLGVIRRPRSMDLSGEANKPLNSLLYGHPGMIERIDLPAPAGQHRKVEHGYRITDEGVSKAMDRLAADGLTEDHVASILANIRVHVLLPPDLSDEQAWRRRMDIAVRGVAA
jgi:hypothetical protein